MSRTDDAAVVLVLEGGRAKVDQHELAIDKFFGGPAGVYLKGSTHFRSVGKDQGRGGRGTHR